MQRRALDAEALLATHLTAHPPREEPQVAAETGESAPVDLPGAKRAWGGMHDRLRLLAEADAVKSKLATTQDALLHAQTASTEAA